MEESCRLNYWKCSEYTKDGQQQVSTVRSHLVSTPEPDVIQPRLDSHNVFSTAGIMSQTAHYRLDNYAFKIGLSKTRSAES